MIFILPFEHQFPNPTPSFTKIKVISKPKVGGMPPTYLLDEKQVYRTYKLFCPLLRPKSSKMMSLFSRAVTASCCPAQQVPAQSQQTDALKK